MIISLSDWLFACAKYKRILTFKRDQKNSFISSRFLTTKLTKICSYLREKASKGRVFGADKLQNHTNEEKAKEKKKEGRGEEKKAMASLLLFIMATSEIGRKKLLDAKGPFGGNVFKNPARYTEVGLHFERVL